MGRPLKIKESTTVDIGFNGVATLTAPVVPVTFDGTEYFGVVGGGAGGGIATATYPTIKCRVKVGANSEADGYIVRQKGSTKYLVSDGTNVGVCVLVDKADGALGNNEMNITFTNTDSTATTIARLTNRWALDYSGDRYLVNFFSDEGSQIKSGTAGVTVDLAIVESHTS